MKKALKILGISLLTLVLLRGSVYRALINYTTIGTRPEISITNVALIDKIQKKSENRILDIYSIADIAEQITKEELEFTFSSASKDPNKLIGTKKANCVGYSAMFNSIANYLIKVNTLSEEIVAQHKIAQLDLLGFDLHQLSDNPFYKDHDFNVVRNRLTGESIVIDPSVSDFLSLVEYRSNKK